MLDGLIDAKDTGWRPSAPPSLARYTSEDPIFLDTETTGLDWRRADKIIAIAIRTPDGKAHYLPFGHAGGNLDETAVKAWALSELRDKHLVFLNARFDIHMFRKWGVDLEAQGNIITDVAHQAALLDDNRRTFNLHDLGMRYLGIGKVQDIDASVMRTYHSSAVHLYAERDVNLTAELYDYFTPQIIEQELERVLELESNCIWPTVLMEENKAPIDEELLDRYLRESEQEILQLFWKIHKGTGVRLEPNKGKCWEELFFKLGYPITHYADGGAPSFTDEVLAEIPNEFIQMGRLARKIEKIRSTFLLKYKAGLIDGFLPYDLNQLAADDEGTVSGRYSSARFNVQQVPRVRGQKTAMGGRYMVRSLFIARPGGLFISADAMQIEYRIFAHYSGSEMLLKAYAANPLVSFHEIIGEMIRKIRPDIEYDHIKIINFTKLYGGGKGKIAESLKLPRSVSDKFVDAYDQMIPEVNITTRRCAKRAEEMGYVRDLIGRRARFEGVNKRYSYKAFNRVGQGGAASVFKTKAVELHKCRKETGFVMGPPVHDEFTGTVQDQKGAEMVKEILNKQSFPLKVPILWSVGTGANWAEAK